MTPSEVIAEHFDPIVGQRIPKMRLADIIAAALVERGFLAPTLIIAPPGIGKTKLLLAIKAIVKKLFPARKTLYFTSGKEMGGPSAFFEDILIPHVHGKEMVMFVDELHEAVADVKSILRSMLETTVARTVKVIKRGQSEIEINPLGHGFFFATNRIDELDPALVSRMEHIDLSLYTDVEMEEILKQSLSDSGITFYESTLRKIAECNRGTARNVVHWSNAIRRHLALLGKKQMNKGDAISVIEKQETYPFGVTKNELATLLVLEADGEQQMKELAAKNQCSPSEQNSHERYLLQRGLITINVKRRITQFGRDYLTVLRADGFIPESDASNDSVQID